MFSILCYVFLFNMLAPYSAFVLGGQAHVTTDTRKKDYDLLNMLKSLFYSDCHCLLMC